MYVYIYIYIYIYVVRINFFYYSVLVLDFKTLARVVVKRGRKKFDYLEIHFVRDCSELNTFIIENILIVTENSHKIISRK